MPSSTAHVLTGRVLWKIFILCTVVLAGCTSIQRTPARLYALDDGKVIHVELYRLSVGHGQATGRLPDGGVLEGSYSLRSTPTPPDNSQPVASTMDTSDLSWAERYGYNRGGAHPPRGTGTLTGAAGFTMHFVIYSIDVENGYGTGLARDGKGTWYRLHIGKPD